MSNILGIIKFLNALYEFLRWAMGEIDLARLNNSLKKIDEAAGRAGDPKLPPKDRLEGGKDLEDEINKRT